MNDKVYDQREDLYATGKWGKRLQPERAKSYMEEVSESRQYMEAQQRATGFNHERERERLERERQNMALMHKGPVPFNDSIVSLYGSIPDERTMVKWKKGYERYEFLRTLAPVYYTKLWDRCIKEGLNFDGEVDRMMEERNNA